MTTNDIRSKFLNFFKSKGHTVVVSDSLVPKDDPTVLFTTAGMQQFKPQFLGRDLTFTKATTCQKCLRTDDLDVVGKTDFHHTFFEMLGNFSFGDYFKKEAIAWAWEFLTVELKLPKDKLWVSVYKDDEEAYQIWLKDIRMPSDRVVKLGDKSNFWPSNARLNGPNGPCGPCSEIFYDYGVNPNCPKGTDCDPDCSCGRFSEVWNLVFTQFNRKEGGFLDPLPAKNIDTGMGLERLAAVVQGKKSNYETDNFTVILNFIKTTIKQRGGSMSESEFRVLADHIRAIVFGIADGVVPSNEGRGYVVRKLIVDSSDLAIRAGVAQPVIYSFVDAVVEAMRVPYPEIVGKAEEIKNLIKRIEEGFIKVRRERVPELQALIAKSNGDAEYLGDIFFLYRDTHGLTVSTMLSVAKESGMPQEILERVIAVFERLMEEQKVRSRKGSKMTGDVFTGSDLDLNVPKTEFLGYTSTEAKARVLKVIHQQDRIQLILDKTPFYAESGGQVGDTGVMHAGHTEIRVTDTQKINDIYIHHGYWEGSPLKEGEEVRCEVHKNRRQSIMRNHTATHLLQSALREVLGAHIKQQGSLVAEDRLRFDFTHPSGVKPDEIQKLENRLSQFIALEDAVITEILPIEEAKKKGALAFFAEKYGQMVRVVSIGAYSREFCGGTHVANTKELEGFKVISEGSVAQGIRRIEAVTSTALVEAFIKHKQSEESLKEQAQKTKDEQKHLLNAKFEQIKAGINDIIATSVDAGGSKIISHRIPGLDVGNLRKLSDLLKQKLPSSVVILGAHTESDAVLLVSVTDDLVHKGLKANELVAKAAAILEGSGGGKPTMAQAGGKKPQQLDVAIANVKETVLSKL